LDVSITRRIDIPVSLILFIWRISKLMWNRLRGRFCGVGLDSSVRNPLEIVAGNDSFREEVVWWKD
jgi:hypothetical protein